MPARNATNRNFRITLARTAATTGDARRSRLTDLFPRRGDFSLSQPFEADMGNQITIAVDGMGGDFAPTEIVKGVAESARANLGLSFIITGPKEVIEAELLAYPETPNVEIVDAPQVIEMAEEPSRAVRSKTESSLVVAARLVKEGRADAFISAGNTGAAMAAALLICGRTEGIKRPAIGVILPHRSGRFVMVDAGANADCKPEYLAQFAVMGSVYAEQVLEIKDPRVGLLNIGGEPEKGSSFTKEAYKLLAQAPVNFVGNIEGREVFEGAADVVVTDGFTGNIVLKVVEGVGMMLFDQIKDGIKKSIISKAGAALMKPVLSGLKRKNDPEETGGAVLLGINGVAIISHGRSSSKAIVNAIRVAAASVEHDIVGLIAQGVKNDG
jgi:phosphate acyltransferase